jgi:excisionase family DNA binding protein
MSGTLIKACANLGQAQQNSTIHPSNGQKSDLLAAGKLTIKEAAKVLRMGETSLRRLIYKGEIHVIRIGAKIMLLESDLEAFLQRHYGTLKATSLRKQERLPSLPREVIESKHLTGRKISHDKTSAKI